jgi:hypothetical protein
MAQSPTRWRQGAVMRHRYEEQHFIASVCFRAVVESEVEKSSGGGIRSREVKWVALV